MSDCISREDALLCLTGEFEKDKEYSPEALIAMFGKRIRKLPPVTPTVDRISCSDRMPEKDKEVFVYLFDNSPYIAWWDGERWHTEDFILDEDDEPLEWYELPRPLDGKK